MSRGVQPRSSSYHRLAQQQRHEVDDKDEDELDNEDQSSNHTNHLYRASDIEELKKRTKAKPSSRAEVVSTKLHALLWIIGAGLIAYFLDVFRVAFRDPRVHR
jgi:hypothetical protein